jgi:D-tyrosyl-tRNA(Tyr) deacylase
MRAILQRVSEAKVTVDGGVVGKIGKGLLILLGVSEGDTEEEAKMLATKTADMRIFADETGKFNLSVKDVGGSALVVSQFTLYANVRKGRRPSFNKAAPPDLAEPLVERFAQLLEEEGVPVQQGKFGAMMKVYLCNDGPVTIILDSDDLKAPRRQHGKK